MRRRNTLPHTGVSVPPEGGFCNHFRIRSVRRTVQAHACRKIRAVSEAPNRACRPADAIGFCNRHAIFPRRASAKAAAYPPLHKAGRQNTGMISKKEQAHPQPALSWSWWPDLNRRPADYESAALPLCYTSDYSYTISQPNRFVKYRTKKLLRKMKLSVPPPARLPAAAQNRAAFRRCGHAGIRKEPERLPLIRLPSVFSPRSRHTLRTKRSWNDPP